MTIYASAAHPVSDEDMIGAVTIRQFADGCYVGVAAVRLMIDKQIIRAVRVSEHKTLIPGADYRKYRASIGLSA